MAIASTTQLSAGEESADAKTSPRTRRKSRIRPWMIAPLVVLALTLGVGGYYALLIRNVFSTIHTINTPPASISGSTLGGSASITIDTSAARTAVAQAAAGIETPTPGAQAGAIIPSPTVPAEAPATDPTQTEAQATTSSTEAAAQPTTAPSTEVAIQPTTAPSSTPAASPSPTATASVTTSQIERVVNGDFEQGAAGWYLDGVTALVSGDHVHGGTQSLVVVGGEGYAGQDIFTVPGSSYQFTFWARMSGSGQSFQAGVDFLDANYTKIAVASPTLVEVSGVNWAQTTITYTTPAGAAYADIHFWNPDKGTDAYVDDISVRGLVSTETTIAGKPVKIAGETNILLMGVDARPGESIDSGVRPDSLMVLHLDDKTGTCRILSIPRDTRTDLPGYGLTKINHALAVGGVDYEELVVQNLLGLKIDHFVLIDFNGFQSLVDAVGGITVNVPEAFTSDEGTFFPVGEQTMSGQQALNYARWRGGSDGDFGRITRQQLVIRALVARASGLNIVRSLNELLPAVEQNLRTDLSALDMASLASDYRSRCTSDSVTMLTLDGGTATYQDPLLNLPLNYVILDPEEITAKVAALLAR